MCVRGPLAMGTIGTMTAVGSGTTVVCLTLGRVLLPRGHSESFARRLVQGNHFTSNLRTLADLTAGPLNAHLTLARSIGHPPHAAETVDTHHGAFSCFWRSERTHNQQIVFGMVTVHMPGHCIYHGLLKLNHPTMLVRFTSLCIIHLMKSVV